MSANPALRLGTRGSELARTQSGTIAAALERLGLAVELTIIKTSGDQNTTAAFGSIGPQGVFVREIEQALVERRVDLAVHSFKDLPTKSPAELTIAAVPARVDPADLLLVRRDAFDRRRRRLAAAQSRRARRHGLGAPPRMAHAFSAGSRHRAVARQRADARPKTRGRPLRRDRARRGRRRAPASRATPRQRARERRRAARSTRSASCRRRRKARSPCSAARTTRACCAALALIDHAPSRAAVTAERDALARAEGGCDVAFGAYCHRDRRPTRAHGDARARRRRAHRTRSRHGPRGARRGRLGQARSAAPMTPHAAAPSRRRVLLTRSEEDCAEWAARFARHGGETVSLPCIVCEPMSTPAARAALAAAVPAPTGSCSRRAAASRRSRRSHPPAPSARCRIAVVGAATAEAAQAELGRVDLVGRGGTAAGLAATLVSVRRSRAPAAGAARARRERRRRARTTLRRPAPSARGSTSTEPCRRRRPSRDARCRRCMWIMSCSRALRPSRALCTRSRSTGPWMSTRSARRRRPRPAARGSP